MINTGKIPVNIDEYISGFPEEIRLKLQQLRQTIKSAAPDAEEAISYQMPAFRCKGILIYFAAYKNHIGFYPTPSGLESFKDELSKYSSGRGSVQFPINEPLPLDLIAEIVKFRVIENTEKQKQKSNRRH